MQYPDPHLNEDTFLSLLPEGKPILVDFYATWCEPCKYLDEILEELESRFEDKVHFIKLDVDEQAELAKNFRIMSVPTLMIYKNGELQWRMAGFKLVHEMVEEINKFL